MGVKLDASSSSSAGGRGMYRPMAEINVTPFVDVMLVLLVVFMVAAPLLTAGVPIDLPDSEAKPLSEEDDKPLEVSIDKTGTIFVGEEQVKRERLIAILSAVTGNNLESRIYIRADSSLDYGKVMGVLGAINGAGFRKVALVSDPSLKTP